MSTTTDILFNSPALHSLKRDQLIKLCKIHNIKANGKNLDLIERLKLHASSLPPDASALNLPLGSDFDEPLQSPEPAVRVLRSMPRPSEQWEVVMDDIDEVSEHSRTLNSIRTVTSNNAGEFGTAMSKSSNVGSSLRAFATSLGIRRAMETPETEPLPQPSSDTLPPTPEYDAPIPGNPSLPGAPAPTHARMSLTDPIESTTIRLVNSAVPSSDPFPTPPRLQPFKTSFDLVMGSPRSSAPKWPASPSKTAGLDGIYPALPLDDDMPGSLASAQPLVQGSSEPFTDVFSSPAQAPRNNILSPPRAEPFLFGSPLPQHRLSNNDFGKAASSVLEEMNKRLGLTGEQKVGLGVLTNRDKPITQPSSGVPPKRDTFGFDKAHDEAFKKMDSIANHYAAKRPGPSKIDTDGAIPGSKKRKSEALGPESVENDAKRKAVIANTATTRKNVVPGSFGDEDEELELEPERRMSKRPRVDLRDEQPAHVIIDEAAAKKAREVEAVRRKAEARRRSSRVQQGINTGLGRQSVDRRTSVVPSKNKSSKGSTSRFGFLSSAKNLVKNVWKGTSATTTTAASSIPVSSKPVKPDPTAKVASTSSKASAATASHPSVSSKPSFSTINRFGFGSAVASTSSTSRAGPAIATSSTGQKQGASLTVDVANNTAGKSRPSSTLMAPTASSLAKMQSRRSTTKLDLHHLKRPSHGKLSIQQVLLDTTTKSPPPTRIFLQPLSTETFASPSKIPVLSPPAPVAGSGSEALKSKPVTRRPRISRSRVIAKLGAQRVAGNTLTTPTANRSSIGAGKVRSSLGDGVRKSYGGVKTRTSAGADALMSAKKKARASEYARRRSKAGQTRDVEMKDG